MVKTPFMIDIDWCTAPFQPACQHGRRDRLGALSAQRQIQEEPIAVFRIQGNAGIDHDRV